MRYARTALATLTALGATVAVAGGTGALAPSAAAATSAATRAGTTGVARGDDSFYRYTGSAALDSYAPGAVLKTRSFPYHVLGLPTPVQAVQILYRTTDAQGRAIANVTSVLKPLGVAAPTTAVSYESFYDSLNVADSPSRSVAGDVRLGGLVNSAEALFIVPELLQGRAVLVPDTQGPTADFAAGPEYGMTTLDSVRAATHAASTGLATTAKVGLLGYSGGAIGSNWTAALAPSYAPEVNRQLVGSASGGLLVDPAHNLKYVSGSLVWSGVLPMAIIGVGRAYGIDFTPYLSAYGLSVVKKLDQAGIADALGHYPGLTFDKLVKPQYANPNSIPPFVAAVNKVNLGQAATPTIPVYIAQGTGGPLEGTSGTKPGIGAGDGVMIAGDVRSLARQYCSTGNASVKYAELTGLSHIGAATVWAPTGITYLSDRFAGRVAPSSCGSIAAGNPLTPEVPAGS